MITTILFLHEQELLAESQETVVRSADTNLLDEALSRTPHHANHTTPPLLSIRLSR